MMPSMEYVWKEISQRVTMIAVIWHRNFSAPKNFINFEQETDVSEDSIIT